MKAGQKAEKENFQQESYLSEAKNWKLTVRQGAKNPSHVYITNLRPDIIFVSNNSKQMGIVELTVPCEERIEI